MKAKALLLLGGIAMSYFTQAQSDTIAVSDSTGWNLLFSQVLPKSSTGIIPSTTLSDVPWDRLQGNLTGEHELCTPEMFNQILLDLDQANLGNSYVAYQQVSQNFQLALQQNSDVPIVILDMEYDEFRSDDSTLYFYDAENEWIALADTSNDSVFVTKKLFAVSVPDSFRFNGLHLKLDQAHYYSNRGRTPIGFQISFNQGQTWTTKSWGDQIDVSAYSNPEIWLKANYGSGVSSLGVFKVNEISCGGLSVPTPSLAPWSTLPSQFQFGNITSNYTNQPSGAATGNAYTWFRPNPATGEENLYKKPVIIVEGIDFGGYNQHNASNCQMGNFGWCSLWGADPTYPLQKMPQILNTLHNDGYDIIMLDFKDGAWLIEENAYLLATLIELVNNYKTSDAEPLVVMGASMGGVVARYALRWMELNNKEHCTRLYLSLDAPHRGAYIPLGVLRFVDFYANNEVSQSEGAKKFEAQLRRPAARQLLVMDNSGGPHPLHTILSGQLAQMGYPQRTRNVAIASGAKDGSTQPFASGAKLFEMSGNHYALHFGWAKYQFTNCEIFALKDYQSNKVFDGALGGFLQISSIIIPRIDRASAIQRMGPSNMPSFDRLSGGQRPTIDEVNRSDIPSWVTTTPIHAIQCFVPLVSALDLQTSNWYLDASLILDDYPNTNLTSFDAIYAAPDNTFHVEITDGAIVNGQDRGNNTQFALKQIQGGGSSVGGSYSLLTSTFNYGSSSRDHVTHRRVGSGGELLLYGNQSDADGSQAAPPSGHEHDYYLGLSDCSQMELAVGNGGKIVIGESSVGNIANFHIQPGSRIIIESGGLLKVKNGSKLIIEDGAELIVHPNAQFVLEGNNAEMVINGKINIQSNAQFTFTGNGHIVLDQHLGRMVGTNWVNVCDDYWEFGANSSIKLQGSSMNDLILVVKNSTHVRMDDGTKPESIEFGSGLIQIEKDQQFHMGSNLTMNSVKVESVDPNQTHGGIRFWNKNATINNCEFTGGNQLGALALHNIGGNKTVRVQYSDFYDNVEGLFVTGEGVDIAGSRFENNVTGVQMDNMSRSAVISTSTFKFNDVGMVIRAQTGYSVNFSSNEFSNNTSNGLELISVESSVFSKNRFLSNAIGLKAYGSVVDLSQEAYNCFEDNDAGIHITANEGFKAGLYLIDGFNKFDLGTKTNGKYISGSTCSSPFLSVYHGLDINAENNVMPLIQAPFNPNQPSSQYILPVTLTYFNSCFGGNATATPIYLYRGAPLTSVAGACGSSSGGSIDDQFYEERTISLLGPGRIAYGGPFSAGLPLRDAILEGAEYISRSGEDVRDDELALDYMQAVLSQPGQNWTAEELRMQELAYTLAKKAFTNLHQYNEEYIGLGSASMDDRMTFFNSYIAEKLNALIQNGGSGSYAEFAWNLDKGQLYRAGNYYTEAIAHLNTASTWASGLEYDRASYWKCVCQAEKDYVEGVTNEEEFQIASNVCVSLYPNANFKMDGNGASDVQGYPVGDENTINSMSRIFPNPASDEVTVEMAFVVEEPLTIQITDVTGRVVYRETKDGLGRSFVVSVSSLSPGVYQLSLMKESGESYADTQQIVIQ